jgi:dTDP-4-amino-4,6-dideoxygalactose transaminase
MKITQKEMPLPPVILPKSIFPGATSRTGATGEHVWHIFAVRSSVRDALQEHLKHGGIETGIHYPIPPHHQKAYATGMIHGMLPITESLSQTVLSLPHESSHE